MEMPNLLPVKIELELRNYPILISPKLYEMFLSQGRAGMESFLLYFHLQYTARKQKTNQVYALNTYLSKGTGMGTKKIRRAKAFLQRQGLIKYVWRRNAVGKIEQVYIKLPFIYGKQKVKASEASIAPVDSASGAVSALEGQKTTRVDNDTCRFERQMLKTKNLNALNKKEKYSSEFETWWAVYPRKVEKKAAFRKYKATVKKGADPKELLLAAKNYKAVCESEDRESRYIKHPATFLGPAEPWREYLVCEVAKTPEQVAAEMFGRGG